jgi:hypothetical protein
MCKHGDTIPVMFPDGKFVDVDRCISDIVWALAHYGEGAHPVASCCGHGFRTGGIFLKDGRYITIWPNEKMGRAFEATQLVDIHGEKNHECTSIVAYVESKVRSKHEKRIAELEKDKRMLTIALRQEQARKELGDK